MCKHICRRFSTDSTIILTLYRVCRAWLIGWRLALNIDCKCLEQCVVEECRKTVCNLGKCMSDSSIKKHIDFYEGSHVAVNHYTFGWEARLKKASGKELWRLLGRAWTWLQSSNRKPNVLAQLATRAMKTSQPRSLHSKLWLGLWQHTVGDCCAKIPWGKTTTTCEKTAAKTEFKWDVWELLFR